MGQHFLLELCVTPGEPAVPEINTVGEPQEATTQATSGQGCRPHRCDRPPPPPARLSLCVCVLDMLVAHNVFCITVHVILYHHHYCIVLYCCHAAGRRSWVFNQLRTHFEHVYMPETQPWHIEFPLDWQQQQQQRRAPSAAAAAAAAPPLTRAVFVASRRPLENPLLHEVVPPQQRRH